MRAIAAAFATGLVVACSAQGKAQDGALAAREAATRIAAATEKALAATAAIDAEAAKGYADPPAGADLGIIRSKAASATAELGRVTAEAETAAEGAKKVLDAIPDLEDQHSPWLAVLWWAMVAASLIAALLLLLYTGVGQTIRAWLGLITPAEKRKARMAYDVLEEKAPETIREKLAAERAESPGLDAAMRKEKRRRLLAEAEARPKAKGQGNDHTG